MKTFINQYKKAFMMGIISMLKDNNETVALLENNEIQNDNIDTENFFSVNNLLDSINVTLEAIKEGILDKNPSLKAKLTKALDEFSQEEKEYISMSDLQTKYGLIFRNGFLIEFPIKNNSMENEIKNEAIKERVVLQQNVGKIGNEVEKTGKNVPTLETTEQVVNNTEKIKEFNEKDLKSIISLINNYIINIKKYKNTEKYNNLSLKEQGKLGQLITYLTNELSFFNNTSKILEKKSQKYNNFVKHLKNYEDILQKTGLGANFLISGAKEVLINNETRTQVVSTIKQNNIKLENAGNYVTQQNLPQEQGETSQEYNGRKVSVIKRLENGDLEGLVKDPRTKTIAILGFLFFGDKITKGKLGTEHWYGRLLWALLGSAYGKQAIEYIAGKDGKDFKKFWENDIEPTAQSIGDKAKKVVNQVSETTKKTSKKVEKETTDFIKQIDLGGVKEKISSFFGGTSDKLELRKGIENFSDSITMYNNKFKFENGETLNLYIEPKKLGKIGKVLFNNEKFLNLNKDKLENIKLKSDLKTLLGFQGNELNGINDTDIKNFINNIKTQIKEQKAFFVRELFISNTIVDSIKGEIIYYTDTFTDNFEIDKAIKELFNGLMSVDDKSYRLAGIKLFDAINNLKAGKNINFDVNSFNLNENFKNKINKILDLLKEYNSSFKETYEKINNINVLDDTKDSLLVDYDIFFNNIKNKSFSFSELQNAFEDLNTKKEIEFFKKAQEINKSLKDGEKIITLGGQNVNDYLEVLNKKQEAKKKEEINKKQAEIQKQLKEFNKKVGNLEKELKNINISNSLSLEEYKTKKQELDKIVKSYEELAKKVEPSIGDKLEKFLKEGANNVANLVGKANIFEVNGLSEVDKQKVQELNALIVSVKSKYIDLWNALDLNNIDVNNIDVNTIKDLYNEINYIKNDDLRKEKLRQLKQNFYEKINNSYIDSLKSLTKLSDLVKIKEEYDNLVKDLPNDLVGDSVKEAYEEKIEELSPKNQKTVKELLNGNKEEKELVNSIDKFIDKYKTDSIVQAIDSRFYFNTTKLIKVKKAFEGIIQAYKNDETKEQLLEDLNLVLEKIKNYLDN